MIKAGEGHIWLLDGYRKTQSRYYYADYYFDEYGKFNAENRYTQESIQMQYVHANMGWTNQEVNDIWVNQGLYFFGDTDFSGKIFFIANIQPKM